MTRKTKTIATLAASALALVPVVALALSTYTMVGNYIMTGSLQVNTLAPGGCVTASAAGKLSATGLACGGGGGVSAVTGSGNIASSGGATPNITTIASPTFTSVFAGNYTDSALTPGMCVQAGAAGILTTTGSACGGGGGGVTSVTSTTALALTASPTTGAVNIAIPTNPIFGGVVTVGSLAAPGGANIGTVLSLPYITGGPQCLQLNGGQGVEGSGAACGGGGAVSNYQNGVLLGGTHLDGGTMPTTGGADTFTFGAPYATPPICQVTSQPPGISGDTVGVLSTTTTNVVVFNSGADPVNISCTGF